MPKPNKADTQETLMHTEPGLTIKMNLSYQLEEALGAEIQVETDGISGKARMSGDGSMVPVNTVVSFTVVTEGKGNEMHEATFTLDGDGAEVLQGMLQRLLPQMGPRAYYGG